MSQGTVLLDLAGSELGGAARWRGEFERYLDTHPGAAVSVGYGRRITPAWLLRREQLARAYRLVIATNNICFAYSGLERRLLLRNALHFLLPSEEHLLSRMPRAFAAKIPIVRRLAGKADLIVVPSAAMAERVVRHLPHVRDRLIVRPHPVTPVGDSRRNTINPVILVPVIPGPYKNLVAELRRLMDAVHRTKHPARVAVTATPAELPADLAAHPRLAAVGRMSHQRLVNLWRSTWAVFYPSVLESFGYPLAEARAYGIPVIAPDTPHASEIAGSALRGYNPRHGTDGLAEALTAAAESPTPEPFAFDRDRYFDLLVDASANPSRWGDGARMPEVAG